MNYHLPCGAKEGGCDFRNLTFRDQYFHNVK
jgi:hypothetical protein